MHPTCTERPWTLIQHCWDEDPRRRLEASEALQVLIVSVIVRPGDHALANDPLSGGNQSPAEPDSRVAGIVPLGGSVCRV